MSLRQALKAVARALALGAAMPSLLSFWLRSLVLGRNRALEGSTQALALLPGILGQYLRRAFLSRVLESCHHSVVVEFGVLFSQCGARLDENVYIGPRCHIGLVHIERNVLVAAGVHIPSGAMTHGIDSLAAPIRDQPGRRTLIRIGEGCWIGSAAVVMADVGKDTIVGAGSVVTRPLPERVLAAGAPARVIRPRDTASPEAGAFPTVVGR